MKNAFTQLYISSLNRLFIFFFFSVKFNCVRKIIFAKVNFLFLQILKCKFLFDLAAFYIQKNKDRESNFKQTFILYMF